MNPPLGLRRFEVVETREAVQLTPDNLEAVAAWCGGTAYRHDGAPERGTIDYPVDSERHEESVRMVSVGDVLVKAGEGDFYDVPLWLFEQRCLPRWREVDRHVPEPPALGVLTGTSLRIVRR